jgi:predicted  nucleic acid-binding Zn-ribbon protein
MLGEELAGEVNDAAANALQQQRDRRETKLAMLRAEQKRLENDLIHLEDERAVAVGSIEGVDYQLYEQLRRDRRGIAVARVSDRACSACGTTLNAMLLQAARSQNQLHRCDTCGRILYVG